MTEVSILDSPDIAFDALDSLEAEHPPTVGVVHAGETEALLPPTLADCRLVWGCRVIRYRSRASSRRLFG